MEGVSSVSVNLLTKVIFFRVTCDLLINKNELEFTDVYSLQSVL